MKKDKKIAKGKINEDLDFFKDANDFLETLIYSDAEEKIIEYMKKRDFNHNERMLFTHMLSSAFDFKTAIARIKSNL